MEYWNKYTETMSREKLDAVELKYFRELFSYAKIHSRLYQEKFSGIDVQDIRTFSDIKKVPFTYKEELRKWQEDIDPFPYGGILGVPVQEVSTFRQTSGTTGRPVYVPESYESWQWRVEAWCHVLWMAGFRPRHRVFLPFGYNVYVAFWEAHYAAEKLGCEVIPGGALDTKGRVNKIVELKVNAMTGTPTYTLNIAQEAVSMGIDPKSLGIERILGAGEPLPEATRKKVEETYNCKMYDHIGSTETCGFAGMCEAQQGLHIIEPLFLVELLDRETLSREVVEGEQGVLVVTPLGRHSFPVVRFNTNDIAIKGPSSCECGRTSGKLMEIVGRVDDITKIRGVLFSPKTVEQLVRSEFPEIIEYELVVTRDGIMDNILARIEADPRLSPEEVESVEKRFAERHKVKTNLSCKTKIEPAGTLPRYDLKAKRFKDLRGKH
ncbi:MAG TPA: AMP-binding protein [Syntrophorhabdaceae bacterium]|nr:AMP-binding protein [Syntrophorhabdaceae bacterium]